GRAADAVAFALAVQRNAPLPLRIGMHTGDVEVVDGGYAGPAIIRAARIRDAGHGGQVLLSHTTADLVADALSDDTELADLGKHQLKGLRRKERVWQLRHPELTAEFPPLRLEPEPSIIPLRMTTFVGRDVEMTHVRDLIKEPGCVTLTGAGGAGKTRLALELVAERGSAHDAPSWFVDLSSVDRDQAVETSVADAVSAHSAPGRSPADSIGAIVRDRDALLVLDNCEHVLDACSALAADLLARCTNLTVIATSREPLGLTGEVTYRLPSMNGTEGTALFVERAQRADPRFTLDASTASVIAEICERLDGMPLAIELAAARMRVFTATQLLDVLHDRFRLLTGGARTALPRQRTLEASVDWSHALLLDAERVLLRRLSVFAGGFTLDAAATVAADGELEPHHVFDLLVQLVEKSLVITDDHVAGRFRMLETIRHYAAARLVDAGEAESARRRHYEYYLGVAKGLDAHAGSLAHIHAIRDDEPNLRRAVQWAMEQSGADELAAMALPLATYWLSGRRAREGSAVLEVLEARTRDATPAVRVRVLTARVRLDSAADAFLSSAAMAREAIALAREVGDDGLVMQTLLGCYVVLANQEFGSLELLDEALTIARSRGDERAQAFALGQQGFHVMREVGNFAAAAPLLREAQRLARKNEMAQFEGMLTAWLCMGGCFVEPVPSEDFERAAALLKDADDRFVLANLYGLSAMNRVNLGDEEGADRDLVALDTLALEMDDAGGAFNHAVGHGFTALARGDATGVVRHLSLFAGPEFSHGILAGLRASLALAEALSGDLDAAVEHVAGTDHIETDVLGTLRTTIAMTRAEVACRRGEHTTEWETAFNAATSPDVTRSGITATLVGVVGRASIHLGRVDDGVRVVAAAVLDTETAERGLSGVLLGDAIAKARATLGEERFDALWAEGAGLTIDEALALVQRGRGSRQRPMLGWDSLTPTEADVARLVAQGVPNKDVAAQLFMSEATVKTHLTRIYNKVGVKNRAQLAASARQSS
ncbi:MAG: LuxR C-terminal-related transcriptional regulator, partial [Acidimicrobiales bacterium]|nr:LuxR C-terminal-related transcriptional regulator [Acidimicrobiales bacterium]